MDMTVELVCLMYANNRLGIKMLTMELNRSLRYRDLDKFTASGAQSVVSSLLLYILVRHLQLRHAKALANSVMPLFLDGAFGTSRSVEPVDVQMKLMRSFHIQPVFFVANPGPEILDPFDCKIGLVKEEFARRLGGVEVTCIAVKKSSIYQDVARNEPDDKPEMVLCGKSDDSLPRMPLYMASGP